MSKSLGNVKLVRDVLAAHGGETVRLALLTAHYRQPLDWTDQLETESRQKLDRLYGALRDAGVTGALAGAPAAAAPAAVLAALEDDLNTPEALAELFDLVRATNKTTDAAEKRALAESLRAGGWLLGLLAQDPEAWFKGLMSAHGSLEVKGSGDLTAAHASITGSAELTAGGDDAEIDSLVKQRDAFRRERNFAEADRIRKELTERGIAIEDVDGKGRWRRARWL
jgi:cysteinyl-tRNA synthetase